MIWAAVILGLVLGWAVMTLLKQSPQAAALPFPAILQRHFYTIYHLITTRLGLHVTPDDTQGRPGAIATNTAGSQSQQDKQGTSSPRTNRSVQPSPPGPGRTGRNGSSPASQIKDERQIFTLTPGQKRQRSKPRQGSSARGDVRSSYPDTLLPPKDRSWMPDKATSVCLGCAVPFTFTRRKHHCRICLKIFCQRCSSHRLPIGRACNSCARQLLLTDHPPVTPAPHFSGRGGPAAVT
eukprot:g29320.t1